MAQPKNCAQETNGTQAYFRWVKCVHACLTEEFVQKVYCQALKVDIPVIFKNDRLCDFYKQWYLCWVLIHFFWFSGFHLSATVIPPHTLAQTKGTFNVAVVFDRRRITSCNCTCNSLASWCAHVVALCLYRIHQVSLYLLDSYFLQSIHRKRILLSINCLSVETEVFFPYTGYNYAKVNTVLHILDVTLAM